MKEKISHGSLFLGILCIIAGTMVFGLLVFVLTTLPTLVLPHLFPIHLAVIIGIESTIIYGILDRSEKLRRITKKKSVNFHGMVVFIASIILLAFLIWIFLLISEQTFDNFRFELRDNDIVNFLLFTISGICLYISGIMWYIGIKNLKQWNVIPGHIKQGITIFGCIVLIVGTPILGNLFVNDVSFGYVGTKYMWKDGPWLTYGEDPSTTITISWLTDTPLESALSFGQSPTSLTELTYSRIKTYLHQVQITDLQPNKIYYYQIGLTFSAPHITSTFNFSTAPASNINLGSFRFIVAGDMQPTNDRTKIGGRWVAEGITAMHPNFVVQLGDVASSGGTVGYWHNFLENMALYGAYAPFQAAVGNHDYGGDNSYNWYNIFPHPFNSTLGNYYDFDYGNAHFINIDNMVSGDEIAVQKEWVEKSLQQAKAKGQKWIFISFHKTIFTSCTSQNYFDLQQWIVPLADRYDVTGVFFGHDHHYEHWNYTYGSSGLLYNQTDIPSGNATQFWCSGGGGANLEVDYGVLTHDPWTENRLFWNVSAQEYQTIGILRSPWNVNRYVVNATNKIYAQSANDELYYHLPALQSYSSDTSIYGCEYGEQALHFMVVDITDNGAKCTISVRYPNGNLMMGPDGLYPQQWTFIK